MTLMPHRMARCIFLKYNFTSVYSFSSISNGTNDDSTAEIKDWIRKLENTTISFLHLQIEVFIRSDELIFHTLSQTLDYFISISLYLAVTFCAFPPIYWRLTTYFYKSYWHSYYFPFNNQLNIGKFYSDLCSIHLQSIFASISTSYTIRWLNHWINPIFLVHPFQTKIS